MAVLSSQSIRALCALDRPLITPFGDQYDCNGVTGGLGPHGYDIRIAEDRLLFWGITRLASTIERFDLPYNIRGITLNKSSWRRRGLEVGAATILEAGWRGHLTLELTLLRPWPMLIRAGTPIAQIEFSYLDEPTDQPYSGRYQDQPPRPVSAIKVDRLREPQRLGQEYDAANKGE